MAVPTGRGFSQPTAVGAVASGYCWSAGRDGVPLRPQRTPPGGGGWETRPNQPVPRQIVLRRPPLVMTGRVDRHVTQRRRRAPPTYARYAFGRP
jgi:hypothetical protein